MGFTQRSRQTRTVILEAARQRFGLDGYERATIRAIAADAGIDPSMVMRYYGSKSGLFAAAAELDLRLPDLSVVPNGQAGEVLVRHFIDRWEGSLADEVLPVVVRSASTNESAAERLRGVLASQVADALGAVIAVPEEAPVRAALVASQLLGVALCRYILRMPPLVALSRDALVADVAPLVQRSLTGPLVR